MAPLLQPAECSLLLIEVGHLSATSRAYPAHSDTVENLILIAKAATLVAAPIVFTETNTANAAAATGPPPSGIPAHAALPFDITATPWSNTELGKALAATNRPCLLLAGCWFDTTVTFAALKALSEGYDVYTMVDATLPHEPNVQVVALERLTQAGIVPISTRPTIREWAACADTDQQRQALLDLLGHEPWPNLFQARRL